MNLDGNITAIIVAFLGGSFSLFAAYIANKNRKDTAAITKILNNTKDPVDSLDKVILVLQRELKQTEERHLRREAAMQSQIDLLSTELEICRKAREQFYKDMTQFRKEQDQKNV